MIDHTSRNKGCALIIIFFLSESAKKLCQIVLLFPVPLASQHAENSKYLIEVIVYVSDCVLLTFVLRKLGEVRIFTCRTRNSGIKDASSVDIWNADRHTLLETGPIGAEKACQRFFFKAERRMEE